MAKNGRRISAKEVLKDIEDGLSDSALMEKYRLSEKGLESLLSKLYSSRVRRIGADSVILRAPADALVEKFERHARESRPESSPPKSPSKKKRRDAGIATWSCPICGKAVDARLQECPECNKPAHEQRADHSAGRLKQGTVPGGDQNHRAGEATEGYPVVSSRSYMDWKMILGGLGSIFLFFGTFTPIVVVPIMGGLNLFQVGKVAQGVALGGYAFMAISAGSIVLVVLKRCVGLWVTGLLSVALSGYIFVQYRRAVSGFAARVEEARAGLASGTEAVLGGAQGQGELGQIAEQIAGQMPGLVSMDWGWLVLMLGSLLLLVSAFMATRDLAAKR